MKKLFALGIAALMLAAFTVPAMAEVKIGGIVFVDFSYWGRDKELLAGGVAKGATTPIDDNSFVAIRVPTISRFYGRWTNEDNVGMYIEFGIGGAAGDPGGPNNVSTRHIYGWWDINPEFTIMAGHSTTPISPLTPNQIMGTSYGLHVIGLGYGEFYSGRFEQVRLTYNLPEKMGRVEFCFIDPNVNTTMPGAPTLDAGTPGNSSTIVPRLELAAALYFGAFRIYPGVAWQEQSYDNVKGDDSITSTLYSIGIAWGSGPFSFQGEFNAGQNWRNMRGLAYNTSGNPVNSAANGGALVYSTGGKTKVEDSNGMGWWVDFGWKTGPADIHLVYGMQNSDRDAVTGVSGKVDATSMMYGISVPIDLAKGFRIRPEIFVYDDGDDDQVGAIGNTKFDYGKELLAGVDFQITF